MGEREIPPVYFHVDLDAFYASVEQRDDPALRGKPVIVGAAPGHRGVVSACSYEARRFGIRSAMPISRAYRLCPQGAYLPVRMDRYLEVSHQVMGILSKWTPHLQQISVDEAFLEMTGTERIFGPPLEAGRRLKAEVRETTGLAISVGIGPNRYVAKLATNKGKPDGLVEVKVGETAAFVVSLPLKGLWGIGEKTLARLAELNIESVARLASMSERELAGLLGKGAAAFFSRISRGEDPGIFAEEPRSHSISSEVTFETDRRDRTGIERAILELCHQVAFRLLEEGWKSKTAVLKLRTHDFTTTTAQRTVGHWISSAEELYEIERSLLASRWDGTAAVRLVGVAASGLERAETREQLELFTDSFERQKRVEEAVLAVRRRMGEASLTKASLLDQATRRRGPSERQQPPDPRGGQERKGRRPT